VERKRLFWPIVVCIVAIFCVWYFCWFRSTTTVVLVRHAEKADASANTNLSPAGLARAQELRSVVDEFGVSGVYSNDFCRTAQTAQPAAQALGLPIFVEQTGNPAAGLGSCSPAITATTSSLSATLSSPQDLAVHILSQHRGKTVLVVGHSNTVAEIIAALGAGSISPVVITEPEFDRLFVVTVPRFFGTPRLLKATYGG
jgi:2,3-bisphosphoglycerate-dependent phosphoglycerate mutase